MADNTLPKCIQDAIATLISAVRLDTVTDCEYGYSSFSTTHDAQHALEHIIKLYINKEVGPELMNIR